MPATRDSNAPCSAPPSPPSDPTPSAAPTTSANETKANARADAVLALAHRCILTLTERHVGCVVFLGLGEFFFP